MRTLFLKLFVWFWLSMALLAAVLLLADVPSMGNSLSRSKTNDSLGRFGEEAAREFERGGQELLATYLERLRREQHVFVALLDSHGRTLTASSLMNQPSTATRDALGASLGLHPGRNATLTAHPVIAADGQPLLLLASWSEPPEGEAGQRGVFGPLKVFLLVIFTTGAFCYGLARYLAGPVVAIRHAIGRLADGDLHARVGASMHRRRDELTELVRDFDRMAERIESLVRAQQRLIGDISHELGSPLARLQVALGLARRHSGPAAAADLNRIETEAERLNSMAQQLLSMARLESRTIQVRTDEVVLDELVKQIAEDASYESEGTERSIRLTSVQKCSVQGSRDLLRSALDNVVRNALRYTSHDSPVDISLHMEQRDGVAVITIRDYGEGVPDDAIGQLFEPFYRVSSAREEETGGTGLGLAITQRVIAWHGGTVRARNAEGGGLIVELRLPARSTA